MAFQSCVAGLMRALPGRQSGARCESRYVSAHRQLSSMSESLGQRVEQVLQVQQKASRVLTHVLGAQYTPCERS